MICNRLSQDEKNYLTGALYERGLGVEVSGDHVLPDYQCEIRRILSVTPSILPPTRYVGATSVDFGGSIDFRVTYVGGDGELYCVTLEDEYSFSVPIEQGADADVTCVLCSVRAEGVSTRVSAPRRLGIRCRLRPQVRVLSEVSIACQSVGVEDTDKIFCRVESAERLECQSVCSEPVLLEYMRPPLADDVRIVSADAYATIQRCEYAPRGVICAGKAFLKLLSVRDGGEFILETRAMDFECECDVLQRNAALRAVPTVSDVSVSVTEEGVECSLTLTCEVTAMANVPVEYTADAYCVGMESRCEMRSTAARTLGACICGNATLNERISLAETSIPDSAEVIDASSRVYIDACERQARGYALSGRADVAVLWRQDGELGVSEVSLPVRYEHASEGGEDAVCFDASAVLDGLRCRVDGELLCVDAELVVSADILCERQISSVALIEAGEEREGALQGVLKVCYPERDDTLWTLSKRYGISPDSVKGDVGEDRFVFIEGAE